MIRTLDWLLKACWDAAWKAKASHFATDDDRERAYAAWRKDLSG